MKNQLMFVVLVVILMTATPSWATTVTVENADASTVTVTQSPTPSVVTTPVIAVNQTPVMIVKDENPREFEGEIINVDMPESQVLVHDTIGRDRRVTVKQGMISGYKVGDYVQVRLMADMKEAAMIRTIRDVRPLEGIIVNVDSITHGIVVRENNGTNRAILVAPGMTGNFRMGDKVRIYAISDTSEAKLIRILK